MLGSRDKKGYDFEAQVRLAESLMELGRIEEAETELRRAQALHDVESQLYPDTAREREADLARISAALDRVSGLKGAGRTRRTLFSLVGLMLVLLLLGVSVLWVLDRAKVIDYRAQSTQTANQMATQEAMMVATFTANQAASTRTAQEMQSQLNLMATDNARRGTGDADPYLAATLEALIQIQATQQVVVVTVNSAGMISPPSIDTVSTGSGGVDSRSKLRVLSSANLRRGPGTTYEILLLMRRNQVVDIIAQDETGLWYNIRTEDGVLGWVHTSLVQLVSEGDDTAGETNVSSSTNNASVSDTSSSTESPSPTSTVVPVDGESGAVISDTVAVATETPIPAETPTEESGEPQPTETPTSGEGGDGGTDEGSTVDNGEGGPDSGEGEGVDGTELPTIGITDTLTSTQIISPTLPIEVEPTPVDDSTFLLP